MIDPAFVTRSPRRGPHRDFRTAVSSGHRSGTTGDARDRRPSSDSRDRGLEARAEHRRRRSRAREASGPGRVRDLCGQQGTRAANPADRNRTRPDRAATHGAADDAAESAARDRAGGTDGRRQPRCGGTASLPTFDFEPRRTGSSAPRSASSTSSGRRKCRGSRFAVLMGVGARLARALINFMLDLHTPRARLHRGRAAVPREQRRAARHRQPAEVRAGSVPDRRGLGSLSHPDRRGAAHEPAPRRDPRRPAAAAALHGLHAVLPERGGIVRRGRARA